MPSRSVIIGLVLMGLIALGLRLAFFNISITHVPESSDESLSILQARMIIEEGRLPLLVLANPYQFPIESYLHTPFIKILPRTAGGARLIPFILNLAATIIFIITLIRLAPLRTAWPALLLLLFPSAYVIMLASAYFIPQHSSFTLLISMALYLAVCMRTARMPVFWALLSGFCAGLAFSNHMLALPLLAILSAYALLGPRGKTRLRIILAFAAGAALGLIPYLLVLWLWPGANEGISGIVSLSEALRRVWGLALNSALAGAMGITPCLFPDGRHKLVLIPGLATGFAVAWIAIMAAVTAIRTRCFVGRISKSRRITLEVNDIFIGLAWLGFVCFLFSARSLSHTYRYLLPVVWMFPFITGYLYARSPRPARMVIGAAVILLAGFNIFASVALMRVWLSPGFAAREAGLFDLKPAIRYLEANGINYAYAPYWLAYRLTYETDNRRLCSQPFNERFRGWFVPYKAQVDAATRVAYLTAPRMTFKTRQFEDDLTRMGVTCQREVLGQVNIYTDFHLEQKGLGALVARDRIRSTASHNSSQAKNLVDGNPLTSWDALDIQQSGMWIQLDLPEVKTLKAVVLRYAPNVRAPAKAMAIMGWTETGWKDIVDRNVAHPFDRFIFRNGHPIYGWNTQTILLPAFKTQRLRFKISAPEPDCAWAFNEIELYQTSP